MKKVVTGIMCMIFLMISGCTFYSGKSLLDDITCDAIDSFSVGFLIYHPNPNQYTRKTSPFVRWRKYKIIIQDSLYITHYKNVLCQIINKAKNVSSINDEEWFNIKNAKYSRSNYPDSLYTNGYGITLFLKNRELFSFGRNIISVSRIGGVYLGMPLSKGSFNYASGIQHNDSTLNNLIFDFCIEIIKDVNNELTENKIQDEMIRIEIEGDTIEAKPIPIFNYLHY